MFKKILSQLEKLGKFIAKTVNTVLLSIVYFVAVGLTFLYVKIRRIDLLPNQGWIDVKKRELKIEDYLRQF